MRIRTLLATGSLVLLTACGGGADDGGVGPTAPDAAMPATQDTEVAPQDTPQDDAAADEPAGDDEAAATVGVASSDLGDILVDGDGMTLYVFLPDDHGEPTCTDACAETWPPLEGPASAGEAVDGSLLGTVEHPSGTTVVTYDGWPLYGFVNDESAGDVNGQGVGGDWYVIGPDGEPIREEATGDGGIGY